MTQKKKTNSHSERLADQYEYKIFETKDENSLSEYIATITDISDKVIQLSNSIRSRDEEHREISKNISDLESLYFKEFSKLSSAFETWASRRRMLIRELQHASDSINKMKLNLITSKLFFSALDIVGTSGALLLGYFSNRWSSKILFMSSAICCLGVASNLTEMIHFKRIIDDVISKIREDSECFGTLVKSFQRLSDFDYKIQELFPHGIDLKIVQILQNPEEVLLDNWDEHQNIIKERFPTKTNLQIALAVLCTNAKKEHILLDDEDFLTNVKIFSQSSLAEKWWNRMKCAETLMHTDKHDVMKDLNSLLKIGPETFDIFPLISAPMLYLNEYAPIVTLVLNGQMVIDAYNQLTGKPHSKEAETLKRLETFLRIEHKNILGIYEHLDPHYE